MNSIKFKKKCNLGRLHQELVAAGYSIHGVSVVHDPKNGDETIVHLKDSELNTPDVVVNDHVYVEPRPEDPKAEYGNLSDVGDKVDFIAKRLGLV